MYLHHVDPVSIQWREYRCKSIIKLRNKRYQRILFIPPDSYQILMLPLLLICQPIGLSFHVIQYLPVHCKTSHFIR